MEPMAIRLKNSFDFSIITTRFGAKHWKNAPLQKELISLKNNPFDQSDKPVNVFLAYCIRIYQTIFILKEKIKKTRDNNTKIVIYSSTDVLPDIIPAYCVKKLFPQTRWIARVHHLIPPPREREGNILVNSIAYLMQYISLSMMKSVADLTLALNSKLNDDLQNRGFKKEKLKILGGGIDIEKINNIKPQKTPKFHAIFLGRLHRTKGIFDTIPIWNEVTKKIPRAKLAIIGDGPEELIKSLQQKINIEKLSNNISLLGFMPDKKIYKIMKNSDIFLFLDHEAGWGLAVAQAMACGLPVVGYDIGVLDSVFKKGYLLSPINDYEKMSARIIKLIADENLRTKLSFDALKEAAKYDWKITSNKFSRLIKNNILYL